MHSILVNVEVKLPMKSIKRLLSVLTLISFFSAVTCFVIIFTITHNESLNNDPRCAYWPAVVPAGIILLIITLSLVVVYAIIMRMESIEKALEKNNIEVIDEESKKEKESKEKLFFDEGEPVKLNKDVTIEGKEFKKGTEGFVIAQVNKETYIVEFDKESNITYKVNSIDLVSYFEELDKIEK